jgi:hypothetical protein
MCIFIQILMYFLNKRKYFFLQFQINFWSFGHINSNQLNLMSFKFEIVQILKDIFFIITI